MTTRYIVRGRQATYPEYILSVALEQEKIEYQFQVAPFGFGLRGAFVIDFLVFNPFPTPVEVYGTYWHTGQYSDEDRFRESVLFNHYGREVVPFWEPELETVELAVQAVRDKLK